MRYPACAGWPPSVFLSQDRVWFKELAWKGAGALGPSLPAAKARMRLPDESSTSTVTSVYVLTPKVRLKLPPKSVTFGTALKLTASDAASLLGLSVLEALALP